MIFAIITEMRTASIFQKRMLLPVFQTTRRHNPEQNNLHMHHCENLKFHILLILNSASVINYWHARSVFLNKIKSKFYIQWLITLRIICELGASSLVSTVTRLFAVLRDNQNFIFSGS